MPVGSKPIQDFGQQNPAIDPAAVRRQLERLLVHPLFSNSKRYPALLAHTVEQTLQGNASELKERSIGIDVFNRSPTYDANADPVVRITAGEVRKRLVQYYYDSAHDGELVIELPIGSYVPVFHSPAPIAEPEPPALVAAPEPPPVALPITPTPSSSSVFTKRRVMLLVALTAGACVIGLVGGLAVGLIGGGNAAGSTSAGLLHDFQPPTDLDRFWAPMTAGSDTATYCLGEPAKSLDAGSINSLEMPTANSKPEPLYFRLHHSGLFALADVITLTQTAAALETRHKAFRVVPASDATFAQLREGPVVLIGAFDNIWTLRVTQKLRFGFESKDGVALIVDRKSPKQTTWATAWDLPYERLSRDYAIVARIHDNITGQPVIIAAGISEEGTESAGEILYNPVYLQSLLAKAPPHWEQMNMEAVIETQVIEGHPGPPNVLAVETW
ncbi:MAG: hypothetical protein ABSE46_10770 [Terracidiphilus sp.]|jgi:hypothetical protein